MLKATNIAERCLTNIKSADTVVLEFPGSGSNANCALRTLRRILSFAGESEVLDKAPKIPLRKEHERSAVFSADQEKAVVEVAPQPFRDVFLITEDSGLRSDEVIRMRFEHVLWDKNLIFNPYGKTEKARRYVPLSDRVRAILQARANGAKEGWIFPSPRKKDSHISYYLVAKGMQVVRERLSLPKELALYSARHTFATDMLQATGNLALVQKMMGHESITTTQRYLHPEMKDVAQLINERNAGRAQA